MSPSYPNRDPDTNGRMTLHGDRMPSGDTETTTGPVISETSGFTRQETVFIIGNKAFVVAVKRALDAAGGFHIVGAFNLEDLQTSLRRSTMLGQTPRVTVIHEPPGERGKADDAAHSVLQIYPGCGIVLISGDELEAESERKMDVHDYNAIVLPETVIKHPKNLANGMHAAISEAGSTERIA